MSRVEDEDLNIDEENVDVEAEELDTETDSEEVNAEEEAVEESDDSEESESENNPDEEDDEEDRIVSIGEPPEENDSEEPEAPGWVKKVRKVNRDLKIKVKQLEKQLAEKSTEKEEPVELGEKPTLKSCGYDDAKWEAELEAYHAKKQKVEAQAKQKEEAIKAQQEAWQGKVDRYAKLREEHAFKDYADVEQSVSDMLSESQKGIILDGMDDPALVVYALGKNPKVLEDLAKITNLTEFACKVSKLETKLKVTNRKAPAPEKKVSSGKSGGTKNSDAELERLRAEAARTGDMTKVVAYKKKMKG